MGQIKYTQQLISSLLTAEPYFSDIPVIRVDDKDLENTIEIAIAKVGVCILIQMPTLICEFPNKKNPTWLIKTQVQVWELPIINRESGGTNKEASEIAETIQATIHLQDPAGDGVFASDSDSISPILKDKDNLVYAANFTRRAGVRNTYNQVEAIDLSDDGSGEITLACATAGNAIFYTTNGNNPGPQSTGATLYTAPFSIGVGTQVKARAWIWGYTASEESTYTRES